MIIVDDFVDSPFDFRARSGRSQGTRIEIAPGNIELDESKLINVDERPFWLLEAFLSANLEEPRSFSHYGENTIPMAAWLKTIRDTHDYINMIDFPSNEGELWAKNGYCELGNEFAIRPNETLYGFRNFVIQLGNESKAWSVIYDMVFILGI
ncbi:MAG TPA: hypothetical protein VFT56_17245 [Sphingomonas sp.]|nr:hypothetical protein [Sphingomonas sp.]